MRYCEKEGVTVEDAINECLNELGVGLDKVDVEIISEGSLFSSPKVKVTVKETLDMKAKEFLDDLFKVMYLDCRAEPVECDDDQCLIHVDGNDAGLAIGYRGDVLDALQYLTLLVVNADKGENQFTKVTLDAQNYRKKRATTLADLANKVAAKAVKSGRAECLEPMNPFERRVIHTTLQSNTKVKTESRGVEPNRYVTIIPVGVQYVQNDIPRSYGTSTDFKRKGPTRNRTFGGGKKKF